jgi:hypothetical protein
LKLPHWFGYRVYFDDERNLCLKGRGFYFFYVLAIMLDLCVGLPIAVFNDRSTVISGTAFFLLFALFVLGFSTSINIIFFKPIQRLITIARSGAITVRDTMIIGRRSFEIQLDEIDSITFAWYHMRTRIRYLVFVKCKDGKERTLDEENIFLFEKPAKDAIQELRTLLAELHRDSSIPVEECTIEIYKSSTSRSKRWRAR